MPAKKTEVPATPELPPIPPVVEVPPAVETTETTETTATTVRVKHKSTGHEFTVTKAYYEQYKAVLEVIQ